jgi:hypothetical protein
MHNPSSLSRIGFVLVPVLLPLFAGATERVRGSLKEEHSASSGAGSGAAGGGGADSWMDGGGESRARLGPDTLFQLTTVLMLVILLVHARHFW